MEKMKVAGFFSGTGGIELGLEQTGFFETAFANEIDSYATETYLLNHKTGEHKLEDIDKLDFAKMPDVDAIVGGFPCQAFSLAGYRQGFEDEKGRGNYFFKMMEAVYEKKPDLIIFENVKGLISHDKGNTLKVIEQSLTDAGYKYKWKVLNAAEYGNVPQGRERIYIVAFKDHKVADNFEFPDPVKLTTSVRELVNFEDKVDDKYYYTEAKYPRIWPYLAEAITKEDTFYQWRRQYVRENKSGVSPTLTANMGTGGHNVPLIFTQHGIRKLTPRECFNLMGYPTDFILPQQSDARLYKQAGNAVVVPVIKRIGEQIQVAYDKS